MAKRAGNTVAIPTLVQNAKKDNDLRLGVGRGNKMQHTREAFKAWLLMPRTFLGADERILGMLGIREPDVIELYGIRTQTEFAARFGIAEPTLSHWKREMQRNDDFRDFRTQMQQLTKNVMGALYRKTLEEADAARVKLWLQVVEGWHETMGYEIAPRENGLSDEEKAALDRLIEKNRGKDV